MATRSETLTNLDTCWQSIQELVGGFSTRDWEIQSLCPDWTVHGVMVHLVGAETGLHGWFPDSVETPLPFRDLGPVMAELQRTSGPELAARFSEVVELRRADLASLTDEQWAAPSATPVGPATYGRFMAIREFDFWVHDQDMRVPLGRTTDDDSPAAEMALDEVHSSLGYIVGKRVGLPDGMSLTFDLTGPVERRMHVRVDGRAAIVDELDDPDVVVTSDSLTFMLLACGRIDPQEPIDDGRIRWTGDGQWGDRAARNLRFTI